MARGVNSEGQDSIVRVESLEISDESGIGLKLGDTRTPPHRSRTDFAFGWRDITGEVLTRGVGATDPAWAQIGSGPFYAYSFALNDTCWMVYHVPHDFAPSTDVHLHVHWISDGTDANPVKWQFKYAYAKGFNQAAFDSAGTTITAQEAASGTAYQHMVTETSAIDMSITEPDGLILVNITRVTNGATDNTDTIFMLTADVHYRSTNLATLNKSPNFYGA